jgi:hypothetical protein
MPFSGQKAAFYVFGQPDILYILAPNQFIKTLT